MILLFEKVLSHAEVLYSLCRKFNYLQDGEKSIYIAKIVIQDVELIDNGILYHQFVHQSMSATIISRAWCKFDVDKFKPDLLTSKLVADVNNLDKHDAKELMEMYNGVRNQLIDKQHQ